MNNKLLCVCSNLDYGTALARFSTRFGFDAIPINFDEINHFVSLHDFGAILIDVNIPGQLDWRGFDIAKKLLSAKKLAFIGITRDYRDYYESDLREGGFRGYILRDMRLNDIMSTIKEVLEGSEFVKVPEKYKRSKACLATSI